MPISSSEFLKHFPNTYFVALDDTKLRKADACINVGNAQPDEDISIRLSALNTENYGIFFTFNQFTDTRKIDSCLGVNAWAIDMDEKDIHREAQKARIKNSPLTPSAIVESKHGYHCYWFAKDGTLDNYDEIIHRLVDHFDADPNAKDVSRLLRVPDYWHCKEPGDKFLVQCIFLKNDTYTEAEMLEAFPKRIELGGVSSKEFWKIAAELNNKQVLTKLSGCSEMNGDEITFKPNSNGTEQIYVNDKSTACWLDTEGMIGSADGGGPTYIQWLQWYGLSKAHIAELLKAYGLVQEPRRQKMFVSYGELLDYSAVRRSEINYAESIKYPYRVLQDTLTGILPDELVVIGAGTGVGKSELAFAIELYNAIRGKKVYGIHLEGRITEISSRHIFNEIRNMNDTDINYVEYVMNQKDIRHAEKAAILNIKKRVNETLKIYNRPGAISISDFERIVDHIQYDADLIVVDHLHYFDFKDGSERNEINKIMQVMKDITENRKIPTVLVSHFNRDKNPKRIPTEDDLMGSSNIGKQADTVVLVYPNWAEVPNYQKGLYPTLFGIPKSRIGLPKKVAYGCWYDGLNKEYQPHYDVWQIHQAAGELVKLDAFDYPYFLKGK